MKMLKKIYAVTLSFLNTYFHSQLATLSEHCCLSRGYSFRFIGHASVRDTLKEKGAQGIIKILFYLEKKRFTVDVMNLAREFKIFQRANSVIFYLHISLRR